MSKKEILKLLGEETPIIMDTPYECGGILADRRTGKTALATLIALDEYLNGTRKIIANYHLNHIPYKYMTLDDVANKWMHLSHALIVMDELSSGADAYEFFRETPLALSDLASQLGKRDCQIIFTDQRFNKVAKRVRDQTDFFILLEKTGIKGIVTGKVIDADYEIINDDIGIVDVRAAWPFYDHKEGIERASKSDTLVREKSLTTRVKPSKVSLLRGRKMATAKR